MASDAVPRALDVNALWHYLSLRSMPDECSMIAGVRKLPAAYTLLRSADGTVRTRRYWTPDFRSKLTLRVDEPEEAHDECLRETVGSHLLSDVPVGTFLSGGIDSTTTGAMMARQLSYPVPASSIGVDEASFDELGAAEQVARAEGMVFHGERVKADIAALLPMLVHHLGEPADPYAVGVYLVSRLAGRHARVLGVLRLTPEERAELFHPEAERSLDDPDTLGKVLRWFDAPNVDDLTDRMLYTDLMNRVPNHNLVMGDRMSMACSLEVRAPFVDPRVVEFAASLPAEMKLKGRKLKYLLRKVAARYLPPEIVRRPKQGFGFPVGLWMQRDLRALVEDRLGNSRLVAAGVFRPEPLARIMREHLAGRVDHSYRLWLLLNLEIWHEIYIEQHSVEAATAGIRRPGLDEITPAGWRY